MTSMKSALSSSSGGSVHRAGDQAHIFNRMTSFVMTDYHQESLTHSRLRNVLRAFVVVGVVLATAGLLVARYLTDDDLRSSTYTVRTDDYADVSQEQLETAICPCRNQTIFYPTFVTARAPLTGNVTEQSDACTIAIVPEMASLPRTPEELATASIQDVRKVSYYYDVLLNRKSLTFSCVTALSTVTAAFNPDMRTHSIGFGENFEGASLLTERAVRHRISAFTGKQVYTMTGDLILQMGMQQLIMQQQMSIMDNLVAQTQDSNDTEAKNAALDLQLGFGFLANLTVNASLALEDTTDDGSKLGYTERIVRVLNDAVTVDYNAYAAACDPIECVYTRQKNVWARIVDFLSTLGGLWTTVLAVGLTNWILIDFGLGQLQQKYGHGGP